MEQASLQRVAPGSAEEAAEILREAGEGGRHVRLRGGGTKLGWGRAGLPVDLELSTERLDAILEHNEGDLTAVVEAGVTLERARETFARAGQMLPLDQPDGGGAATIGGVLATADSGPLRHRHHGARDLVLGVRVALPDGSVARAGSKVIKNVAGYDLGKLMTGAYGTLGLVAEISLRLHPLPLQTVTAVVPGAAPALVAAAASNLAHRPVEAESLDVRWEDGTGAVLARFGGASARDQARAALNTLTAAGLEGEIVEDDDELWERQREAQRTPDGIVVRVSTTQQGVGDALAAAHDVGGRAVGRAALGLVWIALPQQAGAAAVTALRERLAPARCVVLDAPAGVRDAVDPWGEDDRAKLLLMRRVKERFDPHRTCNPGIFAGGI
jgi:glycolate oxidase FAD binding subunit